MCLNCRLSRDHHFNNTFASRNGSENMVQFHRNSRTQSILQSETTVLWGPAFKWNTKNKCSLQVDLGRIVFTKRTKYHMGATCTLLQSRFWFQLYKILSLSLQNVRSVNLKRVWSVFCEGCFIWICAQRGVWNVGIWFVYVIHITINMYEELQYVLKQCHSSLHGLQSCRLYTGLELRSLLSMQQKKVQNYCIICITNI